MKHDFERTDSKVKIMTRLRAEGFSAEAIAREIGAPSRNAVLGKMHRIGMCERKYVEGRHLKQPRPAGLQKRERITALAREDRRRSLHAANIEAKEAKAKARQSAKRGDAEIEALRIAQAGPVGIRALPDWANTPLPGTTPISLVKLESRSCRWPLDTPNGVRYCGCMTPKIGLSYCPSHAAASTSAAARTPDQVRLVASMMSGSGNPNSQP